MGDVRSKNVGDVRSNLVMNMETGAIFDTARTHRYLLWRCWNPDAPSITFIMLNPSRANETDNDPTIRRCVHFAQRWGYGSLNVVNLFAFITPDPRILKQAADPVGAECDRHLLDAAHQADRIVIAWGNLGRFHHRDRAVLELLASYNPIYCLGQNQAGQPCHPLYLPNHIQPSLYKTYC